MKIAPKGDLLYLAHLVESCEKIETYTEGMTEHEFVMDIRTVDAAVRNFEVMGEAAKRISEATRAKYPNVPWRDIARFRDVLIHRYDEVVPAQGWRIIHEELPDASEALRQAAKKEGVI